MRQFWQWWKEDWRGKNGAATDHQSIDGRNRTVQGWRVEPVTSAAVEWTYRDLRDLSKVEY